MRGLRLSPRRPISMALCGLLLLCAPATADVPAVHLSYADAFDEVCAQQTRYAINPAWVSEARSRLPEFQSAWQTTGERLLRATEQIVGKRFAEREFQISLSVCSFPSMAEPLLVNIRFSLKSFVPGALSPDVTISTMFHEILHRYLSGRIPPKSTLLVRAAHEDETVRSHLHLLALQKAVYLKLGLADTLQRVVEKDHALPNKSYGRAWDIVNDGQTGAALVDELKQSRVRTKEVP